MARDTRLHGVVWAVLISLVGAGCVSVQTQRLVGPYTGKRYTFGLDYATMSYQPPAGYQREVRLVDLLKVHPEIDNKISALILRGFVQVGMTAEEAVASWGPPGDIKRDISLAGVREHWTYGQVKRVQRHLFFDRGILRAWKE